MVVNCLTGKSRTTLWKIWKLKDDIHKLISNLNCSNNFRYVPKKINFAAHNLASYAMTHKVQAKWTTNDLPTEVVTLCNVTT